jgi:FtsX-like permease family
MYLLALVGVLAIGIAAAGNYGVMAYTVEQRTREIGVRIALGAQPAQVIRMVLSQALACLGAGLGLAATAGGCCRASCMGFSSASTPAIRASTPRRLRRCSAPGCWRRWSRRAARRSARRSARAVAVSGRTSAG